MRFTLDCSLYTVFVLSIVALSLQKSSDTRNSDEHEWRLSLFARLDELRGLGLDLSQRIQAEMAHVVDGGWNNTDPRHRAAVETIADLYNQKADLLQERAVIFEKLRTSLLRELATTAFYDAQKDTLPAPPILFQDLAATPLDAKVAGPETEPGQRLLEMQR